jgi:hypothetical protein
MLNNILFLEMECSIPVQINFSLSNFFTMKKSTFISLCIVAYLVSGCATTAKTNAPVRTGAYVNGYAVMQDSAGLFITAQGHKLYLK